MVKIEEQEEPTSHSSLVVQITEWGEKGKWGLSDYFGPYMPSCIALIDATYCCSYCLLELSLI